MICRVYVRQIDEERFYEFKNSFMEECLKKFSQKAMLNRNYIFKGNQLLPLTLHSRIEKSKKSIIALTF